MRAGQAGTALGLGRLGRSSNCSSFTWRQGQGVDRTYERSWLAIMTCRFTGSHAHPCSTTKTAIPRYKPLTIDKRAGARNGPILTRCCARERV